MKTNILLLVTLWDTEWQGPWLSCKVLGDSSVGTHTPIILHTIIDTVRPGRAHTINNKTDQTPWICVQEQGHPISVSSHTDVLYCYGFWGILLPQARKPALENSSPPSRHCRALMLGGGGKRAEENTDSGSHLAPQYPVEDQSKLNKCLFMTAFWLT